MKHLSFLVLLIGFIFLVTLSPLRIRAEDEKIPSHEAKTSIMVDGRLALFAISAFIDEQIGSMVNMLKTIAATKEAKSGKWQEIKPLFAEVKKLDVPAVIWFARPDGSYFTVEKGLTDQNLKDRPYFPKVMAGNISVGELVVSRSTGRNVMIVAVPLKNDGKVIGLFGASIYLDMLNDKVLQVLNLPDNMIFYALDAKGITALHFRPEYIFQDPTKLQNYSLANATKEIMANRDGYLNYEFEGKTRDVIYHTSSLTGWHIVLGVVREE